MHRAWRGRVAVATLGIMSVAGLAACLPPGGAKVTVRGAVIADDPPGTVTCRQPGEGGETHIPTWQWDGTIDGESAWIAFSSQTSHVPDEGGLRVGDRSWVTLGGLPTGSTVTALPVTDDGTLLVAAHIVPQAGQPDGAVDIAAALRCPGWGDVTLAGAVAGELDGVSECPAPGDGADARATWLVRSARLEGQLPGAILFSGLAGATVDTALLDQDGVTWAAANVAGQPPQIAASVDDEGVLHASAMFHRLDGQPGSVTAEATVRCP